MVGKTTIPRRIEASLGIATIYATADCPAIEVKSGRSGKTSDLGRFLSLYPKAKPMLLGAQGIPLETFFGREAASWLV